MLESVIEFFKDYGYWGMGMLAFLSGTVVPVASEVLLLFFLGVGLDAVGLTLVATLGNTLGGITCFVLGFLVKRERLLRLFRITDEQMERADVIIRKYGFWAAGLSFLPAIGEVLIILLGMLRADSIKVIVVMALGKLVRYALITASYFGVVEMLF